MKNIPVRLGDRSYRIVIGDKILTSLGARCAALAIGNAAFIVTNPYVLSKYGKQIGDSVSRAKLERAFFTVPAGEKSKSFEHARRLLETLARFDKGKRAFIVAAGGGVTGDLAGFCAAVYKRGIPYVQVPTTLLAQVDSSIGGKTAIDLALGKNLVGAFYQPRLVLSDMSVLSSLDLRQFASGMAEALKYGCISDPRLFSLIEREADDLCPSSSRKLESIVASCSAIKARVVEKDERDDRGVRVILNFGHTIGHALETAAGYGTYTHGEAISIGMACACDISVRKGLLDPAVAARIEGTLKRLGLPVKAKRIPFSAIAGPYMRDKKFKGKSRFVLLERIGKTRVVEGIPLELVKEVWQARSK